MAALYFALITAAFSALAYVVYDNHLAHGGTAKSFFTGPLCVDGFSKCDNYPIVDEILFRILLVYRYVMTLLLMMVLYFVIKSKQKASLADKCVAILGVIFTLFIFWSW